MAKPPYRVMTMEEVRALPWNGFTAASTFSGCGGSSTGYRMAGFRVRWASEFIPAAQETYRANAAPYTVLDGRDIRDVTGAEVLAACGLKEGELDLYDGSPPCAAFSTAGKLDAGWGKVKKYSDTEQRVDDLFFEYSRLLREIKPRVFVAENVAGLVRGRSKGYFLMILKDLKAAGYKVSARVLNAAWLGVPQVRNRLIFVGVREDLPADPAHPSPLPYQYTVRDALPWILAQGDNGGFGGGSMRLADRPSPTIGADPSTGNGNFPPSRVIAEPRIIHDTSGQFSVGDVTDRPSPAITVGVNAVNSHHYQVHGEAEPVTHDPETGQALSIKGYAVGDEWARLRPGEKSQKFFHVRRQHPDQPYDSIMAHTGWNPQSVTGPCHWTEPRKLNLQELRALGGFPPDFVLTGTYAQRWERIGRAVPPVMMSHIATAVRDRILVPLRDGGHI